MDINAHIKAEIDAFDKEHEAEGPGIYIQGDNWIYYADGAGRNPYPLGMRAKPSANPIERYKRIIKYWELRVSKSTREFNELKTAVLNRAKSPHGNRDDDALKKLRGLAEDVRASTLKLNDAREQLQWHKEGCPTPEEKRQRAAMDAEIAERRAGYVEELEAIQI